MTSVMEMDKMPVESYPCGHADHEFCVYAWCTCYCHKRDSAARIEQ